MEGVSSVAGAGNGTDGCAPMEGLRLGALRIEMQWGCRSMSNPVDSVAAIGGPLRSLVYFCRINDSNGHPMIMRWTKT